MNMTHTSHSAGMVHWFLASLFLASLGISAAALELGDSVEQVEAELGRADSYIQIGDRKVFYYDRGTVEAVNDEVVEMELVSQEEADAIRQRREEAKARMEAERREKALARHAEGIELRERKLNDTSFMNASASKRVAFWRSFRNRYPNVELGIEYEEALRELQLDRKLAKQEASDQARIAQLERRVLEAEVRAAHAQEVAYDEARRRDRVRSYPAYPYPSVYVYNDTRAEDCDVNDVVYHTPGVVVTRRAPVARTRAHVNRTRTQQRSGHIRPRGGHNANVHNRALRTHIAPRATYRPYDSIGGYGFQRSATTTRHRAGVNLRVSGSHHHSSASGNVHIGVH